MKRLGLITLLLFTALPAHARRFALVVGNNLGDPADEPLRYAETDARRMASVLREVGQVDAADEVVVLGANSAAVRERLEALESKLKSEARPGDQLVLYFSGHADEGELHLGGGRLSLTLLNEFARRVPVDVVLLIIDSCHSGAVTRLKGLKPAPDTSVSVELPEVKGRVVLGSAGPDEYAQESDTLGGSYFTTHLVAALRGAADSSHDGAVSLQEAYEYAYAHTVESTFATRGGVQHPSYHVDLRGQGDLVLSRPGEARGRLRVELPQPGALALSDARTGALVGEFIKGAGATVLALEPGEYQVRVRTADGYSASSVTVPTEGQAVLSRSDLVASAEEPDALKGPGVELAIGGAPHGFFGSGRLALELGASLGTGLTRAIAVSAGLAASGAVRAPMLGPLDTIAVEGVIRRGSAGYGVDYLEQTVDARAGALASFELGALRGSAGPMVGGVWVEQSRLPGWEVRDALLPEAGGALHMVVPLTGPFSMSAALFAGGTKVQTDLSARIAARVDGSLGLRLEL